MRFGIVVTDDDPLYGGEKGVGEHIVQRFEERNSAHDHFEAIHAVTGKLPGEEDIITYDGFLLTGAHFSANEELPWMKRLEHFIRMVYKVSQDFGRPRMVGICFGHQLIAKALGGRIDTNPDDVFNFGSCEVTVEEEFLNQEFTKLHFGVRRQPIINLMKFHGECVVEKPPMARVTGSSKQCKYELLMYNEVILTTQGHPEYTKSFMKGTNADSMKQLGILDPISIKEKLKEINDSDEDNCTEMVRSFLRHTFNEKPGIFKNRIRNL